MYVQEIGYIKEDLVGEVVEILKLRQILDVVDLNIPELKVSF